MSADDGIAETQPVREDYWVEVAGQDSDDTGTDDRVHVEVARPQSTTDPGVTLPVVVQPSPYYGDLGQQPLYEMETELWYPGAEQSESAQRTVVGQRDPAETLVEFTGVDGEWIGPSFYEETFRGDQYVWAYAASLGTEESTGCPDTGGEREVNGLTAVVDWFNGRATAYDAKTGGSPVEADWTDGTTGMIGRSYNGTLPNAAASRGIDGLETIVPVAAISSWYSYYRMNGHVVAPGYLPFVSAGVDTDTLQQAVVADPGGCSAVTDELGDGQDRTTADYNEFWAERDYRADASAVEASVLLAHGLADYNVRLRNAAEWLAALDEQDVPYTVLFHQGGHEPNPRDFEGNDWLSLLGDWFDYWLRGVDNGVTEGPTVRIQRGDTDGPFETYPDWPDPAAGGAAVAFQPGGEGIGGLGFDDPPETVESLVDDSTLSITETVDDPTSDHRLVYRSVPLEESVRLSGTPAVDLRMAVDEPAAIVSVALFDFGPDGAAGPVNFGWMNPHNRNGVANSEPITPGTFYPLSFQMQPVDHVFEAGHQIALAVYSSDVHFTLRPPTDPELSLSLAESDVTLPVVGGEQTLASALGLDDEMTVTATGQAVAPGGTATLKLDGEGVTEMLVDGLWSDWTVVAVDPGPGSFTRDGRTGVFSYDTATTASASLTVAPPDRYQSGTYLLQVEATDGVVTATDTAAVEITQK